MQNGYIESFNGRMRDELLNESLFLDFDQTRQMIAAWIADYNTNEAAFLARLQDTGSLRRTSHRTRPSRCAT
jgi:transposase InsO family protein